MKLIFALAVLLMLTACPSGSGEPAQPSDSTRIDTNTQPLPRAQRGGGRWLPTE